MSYTAACDHDYAPRFGGPRPKIVVLCGSTRFRAQFELANRNMTLAGYVVLAPGVFGHADGVSLDDSVKAALDALHLRKIDLADMVLVVSDASLYYGDSTRSEIAYAKKTGKRVSYWSSNSTSEVSDAR
ncbi:MAG TPA: hypothetical protein VK659_29990 [Asanoa sp.]|nr:hypothetical protein [Asanoa sp.]